MGSMKKDSISPTEAKTLITLETLMLNELIICFYYIDNGKRASMQWDLTNPEDSNNYDGTDDSIISLNQVVLKYLVEEGFIDVWNKFLNNPRTQSWVKSRSAGGWRKPRKSTIEQLVKVYDFYKNKYTKVKL